MCEYLRFNPNDEKEPPKCTVTNEMCVLCVLGNAGIYKQAKEAEKEGAV